MTHWLGTTATTLGVHRCQWISRAAYTFPEMKEEDLEEQFISGHGPGGQNVNKSQNCVFLRHRPSGLHVKVHDSRSLAANRQIARQRLREKLDAHLNGDQCFLAQRQRLLHYKEKKADARAAKLRYKRLELKDKIEQWVNGDKLPPIV